mmetsp:Transcript_10785/g.35428  ORF Transcript_10785/g.35428 Transcript_10785/m.35428 type:complete len:218 (-) Transcript_10785:1119-1772(-)
MSISRCGDGDVPELVRAAAEAVAEADNESAAAELGAALAKALRLPVQRTRALASLADFAAHTWPSSSNMEAAEEEEEEGSAGASTVAIAALKLLHAAASAASARLPRSAAAALEPLHERLRGSTGEAHSLLGELLAPRTALYLRNAQGRGSVSFLTVARNGESLLFTPEARNMARAASSAGRSSWRGRARRQRESPRRASATCPRGARAAEPRSVRS